MIEEEVALQVHSEPSSLVPRAYLLRPSNLPYSSLAPTFSVPRAFLTRPSSLPSPSLEPPFLIALRSLNPGVPSSHPTH
ncbi:hypothetical protein EJ06DRAFT_415066 [Trichodelitschia bisporula]|uniref:Uncharacterized protein n=1 Tax=Trichodelitschia bisporula TaxID=703511 RepID=A0A6G1HYR7_9PEZI|nr:hypothetical protein EJ06DRAFT_415066 [Trichodelitschia bisporula]